MSKVKPKYQAILDKYLRWIVSASNLFLPPLVEQDDEGLPPDIIMRDWESQGVKIPMACSDPLLLAQYIQGKTLRDWHITEWRNAVKEGLFLKQEFTDDLVKLGEDPALIFKNIENNMSWHYATILR